MAVIETTFSKDIVLPASSSTTPTWRFSFQVIHRNSSHCADSSVFLRSTNGWQTGIEIRHPDRFRRFGFTEHRTYTLIGGVVQTIIRDYYNQPIWDGLKSNPS
jgi:hypothetical protein